MPLRIRSMVGIIPLFAVEILDEKVLERLPGFKKRLEWFVRNRTDLASHISYMDECHLGDHDDTDPSQRLLAIPSRRRLERMLRYLLDENEFLSDYGIRALSKVHEKHPFVFQVQGQNYCVDYVPGESTTVCSVATPTGEDQSGFPSIFSSLNRSKDTITSMAILSKWNALPFPAR